MGNFLNWYKNINDGLNNSVGLNKLGLNAASIGGIANTLATTTGQLLAGQNTTGAGQAMQGIGSALSNIPGIGGIIGSGVNLLGGITNAMFGSNINEEFVNQTKAMANQQANYVSGASDNAQLLADFNNLTFLGDVKKSDVGSEGWFSNKVTKKTIELNKLNDEANMRALASLVNTAENIDRQNDLMLMANYSANGGKIYIKPKNRGKFTKYCGGKVTSECIARGKKSSDPAVRKRATFAANARKWHHADGGFLSSNGADWSNGVTIIGNGDTHENNKYEGVQIGMDAEGIPNLVEEGEVIFNDYVFSNRLNIPKSVKSKYKLRGNKTLTFADAAKQMQKESEERPNDPISKRGLEDAMLRLQGEQEVIRQKKDKKGSVNRFDYGSWLRYAPVAGSAIGLGYNLFSKPDYSGADAIMNAADAIGNYTPVSFTPVSNYLTYKPLDVNRYTNRLDASTAATRRNIINTSGGNRAAALTGLLALDKNYGESLGELGIKGEEYNLAQRQAVEQFNRGTNQANAEMGLKAAMANAELAQKAKSARAEGIARAVAMRDEINARRSASMSANLTNLFDSLGNIGIDRLNRADRDFYIKHVMGANLPLNEYKRLYGLDAAKEEAKKRGFTDVEINNLLKCGGKLKKKRGGFTY